MRVATLTVRSEGRTETFEEVYREGDGSRTFRAGDDIEKWAVKLIAYFNETCRPGERHRELIAVRVEEAADVVINRDHDWHKTNLVTLSERGQCFDRMECNVCGVTGKRHGLTFIKRDSKFRAKKYTYCSGGKDAQSRDGRTRKSF